jgi:hypothetical protein
VLTLSGSASAASYQDLLRSVGYANTSDNPTVSPRTFTFVVDDGSSEADHLSNSLSQTVVVHSVNDAPDLADNAALPPILQGTPEPLGQTVTNLFRGLFVDPDQADSLGGVAVVGNTAIAATQGTWQFSTDSGTSWFDVAAVADGST